MDAETPLFSFGVIADIQYADTDDGSDFSGTRRRYYRSGLRMLRRARRCWSEAAVRPRFVLQLGDVIDGVNKLHGASERALQAVLSELRGRGLPPVHHAWGNHELYNFSREQLIRSELNDTPPGAERGGAAVHAYMFRPLPGFVFVLLDGYDVSPLGREPHSREHQAAMELIREHNTNEDPNCPPDSMWDLLASRFTMFNGGFSKDQLDWLDSVLSMADQNQEKVTVLSHLPVHPKATSSICLAWNYDELLAVLRSHPSVVCYMAGHDHDGGYCRDEATGVHHLTFEGVVETPPDSDAFATVFVYRDRMELKGRGRTADRVLHFPVSASRQ